MFWERDVLRPLVYVGVSPHSQLPATTLQSSVGSRVSFLCSVLVVSSLGFRQSTYSSAYPAPFLSQGFIPDQAGRQAQVHGPWPTSSMEGPAVYPFFYISFGCSNNFLSCFLLSLGDISVECRLDNETSTCSISEPVPMCVVFSGSVWYWIFSMKFQELAAI